MNRQRFIPLLVIAAGLLAYHNSLTGPFIFDDVDSILENPTIRRLWPIWEPLSPRIWQVQGRPLTNLSLAINYALGGYEVWSYHVLNLAIHLLAGLTLLGVVRRTLLQPTWRGRFDTTALPLALAIAVIWTVHPLQTESVTYVVQRAESLMGLFYLLTLYCFIRGAESPSPGKWYAFSVTACLLGMASKEVMISAPVMVLLYDRVFVAGSLREAWRRRWPLYVALATTWILLGYQMVSTARGGGYFVNMPRETYALTQLYAIAHYLQLAVWPHPLVFDYGTHAAASIAEVVPHALIVALLLGGTLVSFWRWPSLGFVGVWFFAILAPTSSVIPLATQTIAERRMYLPLAAVVAVAVFGAFTFGKHLLGARQGLDRWVGWSATGAVALLLGFLTIQRNFDYRSALAIWQDTINKCPDNPRAHLYMGNALSDADRLEDAIQHYEQALRISPDFAKAHNGLGIVLARTGRIPEAIEHFEQAIQFKPDLADAHYNLAHALIVVGKVPEAVEHLEETLLLKPDDVEAHYNLGNALAGLGRLPEAVAHWEQAVRLKPDFAEARNNLALARKQSVTVEDDGGR